MSLLWTGRDAEGKPQPDDLDNALGLMVYTGIAAVVAALLAIAG